MASRGLQGGRTYVVVKAEIDGYSSGPIILEDTESKERFVIHARQGSDGHDTWAALCCDPVLPAK